MGQTGLIFCPSECLAYLLPLSQTLGHSFLCSCLNDLVSLLMKESHTLQMFKALQDDSREKRME